MGVLLGALAPVLDAQDAPPPVDLTGMSLEQLLETPVVTGAAKREQQQKEAAASVSVVTDEEINLLGHRHLADVLRSQRGFYLHTDGLNWFAGVRGFIRPGEWNARILVLADGRPTRDAIYGTTHLDQDFVVPIEAVKRVEIIRGPGSALYGSNAVFGVINVVTKDGSDLNGAVVRVQGGTHDTGRIGAMWGTKTEDGWDLLASLSGYTSEGEDDITYDGVDDPGMNFGHVENADGEQAAAGFFKVKKGDFSATFDAAHRDRENRSATYLASFFDPGVMREDRANLTFRFDHEVAEGQSVHAMAYLSRYHYRQPIGYQADPETDPSLVTKYVSQAEDDWAGGEVHYDWQVSEPVHLLFGADGTHALYTVQRDRDEFGVDLRITKSYSAYGIFGEAEFKATEWLTLVAGARLDDIQRVGTQFSPRAAAIVSPTKADTVKVLYGRAFRPPNLYEMFYRSPGSYTPNPGLEPEVVDTYEAVWERQFASGWRTSLGGFYWRMSDALDDVVLDDDTAQAQNRGKRSARGVEAEVQRQWQSGARVRAYGAYTRAENEDGEQINVSPEYVFGGSLIVPVFGRNTFLAIDPQVVGPMKSDLGEKTDPTFITNIVLTAREFLAVKGLELQVGAYNLTVDDARLPHGDVFQHAQPTLNWPQARGMVTVTYRF